MTDHRLNHIYEKLLTPIVVNLTTAMIVFILAVLFKGSIITMFRPHTIVEFPYIVATDTVSGSDGKVRIELFIINRTRENLTWNTLTAFLTRFQEGREVKFRNPGIAISVADSFKRRASILEVIADGDFNGEKGSFVIEKPEDNFWTIKIERLDERQIAKFEVITDWSINVSRGAPGLNPLKIDYPGG